MEERGLLDWKDTTPGDNPVCLVGAGFQKAALKNSKPSTEDIVKETVQKEGNQFPILSVLYKSNISPNLRLNYIWENIWCLSLLLANYYPQIYEDYSSLDDGIPKVIEKYEQYENPFCSPQNIIGVVLELELKKMVAYHYDSNKIGAFKGSAISNINYPISQSRKFTWISLNYDIVLEKMLVCEICKEEEFNSRFRKVRYSFDSLLTTNRYKIFKNPDSEHLLIKPHGSLNVVFKTDNQNTDNKIHKIYFQNENNYFDTFDWKKLGYNTPQNKINEKRPWMIGYLPDALKDELNSKALFSDLAHDLCKWNMAYTSFALEKATSIFILGYSMPIEDRWIWERVRNIGNKNLNIYVASGRNSDSIVQGLWNHGFTNVEKVNNGYID